ncbi:glycosyltransferase family 4 protein [soil metagenome]
MVTFARGACGRVDRAGVNGYRRHRGPALLRALRPVVRDAGRLAYGRRHGRRLVDAIRRHDPDVILETHVAFSAGGAHAAAVTGVPLVIDDLAPRWEETTFGVGLGQAADRVWRRVTDRARVLVAVNAPIHAELAPDVDDLDKLIVVGNGYDARWADAGRPRADTRAALGIAADTLVLTFVGSFLPWHRADLLVTALADVGIARPWQLLLIGDGPCRTEVARTVADRGLADHVTFTGAVPSRHVADHLRATDIAVLPATNPYGNPMKLVEYLALGTTVVAPDQTTVTELCTHGETAWLFTPDSSDALGDALRTVAADDRLAGRLAGAAAVAAADLRWDRQAERLVVGMHAAGIGDARTLEVAPAGERST